ncbi:MFS domain-containing protein [Mycena indigotica]|uniref:MFS domain-containing protein n=1 Tax=Mycena indigotica TaxID=2126181 RepID=A0A8H6WDG1_9AGAR|nr:MFS domain-containing protein [Mycena indigotica]KAF7312466.1 MFS domain-containing protein [Mycena indigotica]
MLADQLREIKHYRNAYLLSLSAAMGSVFYGYDIGIIGGVISLPSFKNYFGITKMSDSAQANFSGNIVSVLQGGCFFGALGVGYFSNRWGRKPSLIAAGLFYIIGSVIQAVVGLGTNEARALSVFYFARFFAGLGVGIVSAVVPTYVSECTPKAIRGRCTGMVQLANNIGIMISYFVNYSASLHISPTSDRQWRMPLAVQVFPGILFLLLIPWQPESPRFLVEHGRLDQAARSLAYVARTKVDDQTVLDTVQEIRADFEGRKELGILQQIRHFGDSRAIALRCFIPSLVMFFQQATGTNAINYFSPQIFASLGITGTKSGLLATGIYGVVKVISVSLVLAFAVEGIGRKRCLIIGGFGQGAMMLWLAGYTGLHPAKTVVPSSYVSLVAVYLYAVFYCVGWGPLPWVVAGEVAPNHLRTGAMSIAIGVNWLFSFTVSKLTPIMLNKIHYGTYLLFGLCCLIMATWAWVCLPETAGVALEDIGLLFEKDVVLRAIQDGPGGAFCLGSRRRAETIEKLRRESDIEADADEKATTEENEKRHNVI